MARSRSRQAPRHPAPPGRGATAAIGFSRSDGRLDRNFRVASGDATVSIGEIHHASPTPSTKLVLGVPATTTPVDATVSCPTRGGSTSTPCPLIPPNDLTCCH